MKKRNKQRGATLTETLVVIAVIAILAAIMIPTVCKAYRHCKGWIWGTYAFNENRLNAFVEDNEKWQDYYLTNVNAKPFEWTWVKLNDDGTVTVLK